MPDSPTKFELADESGLLGVAALASLLGVSDETIYNWEKRGMSPAKVNADGVKVWDPAACRAWREKHGPSQIKGGRRRGAGRKSRETERETKSLGGLAAVFAEKERELLAAGVPENIARGAGDISALMEAVKSGKVNLGELETMERGFRAAMVMTDLKKKTGELVSMSEAEAEFGQYLSYARIALDNLPGRAAPEITAEFKLPAAAVAKLREILTKEVEKVKEMLRERK